MIIVYAGLGRGADSVAWTAAKSNSQTSQQRDQGRTQRTMQTLTFDLGRTSRLDPNHDATTPAGLGVIPELGMDMDLEAEGEGKVVDVHHHDVDLDAREREKEGEVHDSDGMREGAVESEKVGV